MIKNFFLYLIIFFCFSFLFAPKILASNAIQQFNAGANTTGVMAGYTTTGDSVNLPKRIGKVANVAYIMALGISFLALMIYSGYIWMLARGNEQEVEKAKKTIQNAIIGLIIAVAAYGIAAFVSLLAVQAGII